MTMRTFVATALIASCLAFAPPGAGATSFVVGVPNLLQAPGTGMPCVTFQVGTVNETFVLPVTDAKLEDEFLLLRQAFAHGKLVTFTDAGTTVSACGSQELAQSVVLGQPACPNNLTLDLTSLCDVAAAVAAGAL